MTKEYCYCEYEDGIYYSYEETAIDAAMNLAAKLDELKIGATLCYYRGEVHNYKSEDFITDHRIENFMEDLNCAAQDEVGEAAEYFPDHLPEAREELRQLLKDWMKKHVTCDFYGVRNVTEVEFTVTEEMYNEFIGENK